MRERLRRQPVSSRRQPVMLKPYWKKSMREPKKGNGRKCLEENKVPI